MKKGGHMIHYVGSFSNLELQNGAIIWSFVNINGHVIRYFPHFKGQ